MVAGDEIQFFRQQPERNLIVRAHPDEVWVNARLRMAIIAHQYTAGAQNIFVIGGEEDINTYSLVENRSGFRLGERYWTGYSPAWQAGRHGCEA